MSLKSKFIPAITLAVAVGAFSTFASAQTTTTEPQQGGVQRQDRRDGGRRGGKGMHGEKRGGGKFGMHGLRGINLTDAQKEQLRGIMEANRNTNQGTDEEFRSLRKAKRGGTLTAEQQQRLETLKSEMKQKSDATKAQVLAILTPEQRTQLEQQKQEMQKMRQEHRQTRREKRQAPDTSQDN